jgi:hypothetical protein
VLGTVGDADGAAAGERAHMQMTMDLVAVSNIQRYRAHERTAHAFVAFIS